MKKIEWLTLFGMSFQVTGPTADRLGHLLVSLEALLLGVLTFYSWRR